MDQELKTVMELSRDPMLATRAAKIVAANSIARAEFPDAREGASAVNVLPDNVLFRDGAPFTAAVELNSQPYSISRADCGELRVFRLRRIDHELSHTLVSGGMLMNLVNVQSQLQLAAEQLSLSMEKSGDERQLLFLAILRHSVFSLSRQLSNLRLALQFLRGEASLSPRTLDLAELCRNLTETVSSLTKGRYAALEFSAEPDMLPIRTEKDKVERILLNLLSNSLNNTPSDGSIRVHVRTSGGDAVISVEDTGYGIPEDIMQNVFCRFENRLDDAHLDRAGTAGLGLFVSMNLARLHGGTMMIESRVGRGTTVMVRLPRGGATALECPRETPLNGMQDVLRELSTTLGTEAYSLRYLD